MLDFIQSAVSNELSPQELISQCSKAGNAPAWSEFIRRYDRVIRSAAKAVARRWGHESSTEIEDLTQEIYLKLCSERARLLFAVREKQSEAIFSYLKVLATNSAHDYFRAKASQRRGQFVTESISELDELGSARGEDIDQPLILREIDQVLQAQTQVDTGRRDRAVFRLYYKQGLTAKEIANLPGIQVSIKGVEAIIHRLTVRIQEHLAASQENSRKNRPNEVSGS
jgi:RNA polymerase sigma factor (sigma-70 family)